MRLSDERGHHAAAAAGRPQRRQAGSDLERVRRTCRGPRISTRRSPIRSTPSTSMRRPPTAAPNAVKAAIAAGKNIYCEKPIADSLDVALRTVSAGEESRRQARRRAGQAVAARHAEAEDAARYRLLRRDSFACAASSATGCSKATRSRRSGRRGTTARKKAAASSSTCCATGATCSTICSAK